MGRTRTETAMNSMPLRVMMIPPASAMMDAVLGYSGAMLCVIFFLPRGSPGADGRSRFCETIASHLAILVRKG